MVKIEFDVKEQDAIDIIKFAKLLSWSNKYCNPEGYRNPEARQRVERIRNILDGKEGSV